MVTFSLWFCLAMFAIMSAIIVKTFAFPTGMPKSKDTDSKKADF